MSSERGPRPEIRAFFQNFRQPMPAAEKLRLALRNNWLKLKNRESCCGHPGEPGC